ncbi:prepilin-type N-terminal cleavage/methylation domain-containing protein [Planktomarina temperata]|nr:prepilin-type N-terminal cleavage/methylation domain-containing protein [Planktomarina temperata]
MRAFSLLEVLVALVLVGVIITVPNWFSILDDNLKIVERDVEYLQLQVLLSLSEQTFNPIHPIKLLKPLGICEGSGIALGSGGIADPKTYNCNQHSIYLSKSGQVYVRK